MVYLEHYGVKGMKWGVRKDDKKSITLPTDGHVIPSTERNTVKVINLKGKVTKVNRTQLPRLLIENRNNVGVGGIDKKLYAELYNELSEEQLEELEELGELEEFFDALEEEKEKSKNELREELSKSLSKEDKKELKNMKKELNSLYDDLSSEDKERVSKVKEAVTSFLVNNSDFAKKSAQSAITAKYKVKSFMKEVKNIPKNLANTKEKKVAESKKGLTSKTTVKSAGGVTIDRTPVKKKKNFLKHYGVKGMKWGVRKKKEPTVKFINPDGTVSSYTNKGTTTSPSSYVYPSKRTYIGTIKGNGEVVNEYAQGGGGGGFLGVIYKEVDAEEIERNNKKTKTFLKDAKDKISKLLKGNMKKIKSKVDKFLKTKGLTSTTKITDSSGVHKTRKAR